MCSITGWQLRLLQSAASRMVVSSCVERNAAGADNGADDIIKISDIWGTRAPLGHARQVHAAHSVPWGT